MTKIEEGAFFSTFDLKEILVDDGNPNYKSENGSLLLAWPDGAAGNELVTLDGVVRIGEFLFYGRYADDYTVVLPETVKEIGTMSLPRNMALLTLPASLEKIDDYVFYDGMSIGSLKYNGTAADWEKITIGEGNTALGNPA